MKIFLITFFLVFLGCSSMQVNSSQYRIYQLSDMEDSLQDYYANDLKKIAPGIACASYKMSNAVGCFKLIVDKRHGKVIKLIYDELQGEEPLVLYRFDYSANIVFIEKIFEKKLESSRSLPEHNEATLEDGQPSVKLVFMGKSAVVFYWQNGKFNEIWTAD